MPKSRTYPGMDTGFARAITLQRRAEVIAQSEPVWTCNREE